MKKMIALMIVFLLSTSQSFAFTDTENSWYNTSITELENRGIVTGYEDGTFAPRSQVTRAELLKIILGTAGTEVKGGQEEQCFADVPLDAWFSKYICSAFKLSIAKGYDDGKFLPDGNITVIEAITFATRALKVELPEQKKGEPWYQRYILYADENNIIPKNAYTIDTLVTRGQAAEIIIKMEHFSKKQKVNYNSEGCGTFATLPTDNTLTINGKERKYIAVLPANYDSETAYPLMIGLHGRTNSNEQVKNYMGLSGRRSGGGRRGGSSSSTTPAVIALYPAGVGDGPYSWESMENIDFFDAMVAQVSKKLCVDKSDVNIVGHSLGAHFANKLACLRGDVIATMTGVGGGGYKAKCAGPVATLIMHRPDDPLEAFSNGQKALAIRREVNQCSDEVEKITLGGLSCQVWADCSAGNPVAFCTDYTTLGDYPHSWPSAGAAAIYSFREFMRKE